MKETQKRVGWLDAVRALAILLVVCNHSIEQAYTLTPEAMQGYAAHSRLIALAFFSLGRLGVPLFFFLSGYLLLDRHYDRAATERFFRRNVLGLLVTTEIWILLYNLFNSLVKHTPLQLKTIVMDINFFQNADMSHMWYMPVILGIYLFVPFVANALHSSPVKCLYIPMLAAFFHLFVRVELNVILQAFGRPEMGSVLDVSFSGGRYGFYLILGYLVKKGAFDRIPGPALGAAAVLGWGATVGVQWLSYARGAGYNVWYDNATLLVAALALFLLLGRLQPVHPALSLLARCSFGIYLVHNPIMILLGRWLHLPSRSVQFLVVLVIDAALSLAIVWLAGRQPSLGQWLFFMKPARQEKTEVSLPL